MLQLTHFGHSDETECLELVTMFSCIEDVKSESLGFGKGPRHESG